MSGVDPVSWIPHHLGKRSPGFLAQARTGIPENALAELSALERKVLDLRYGEDPLTVRQTAERLGMSNSSVQRTYQRAKRKLRGEVKRHRKG